jgi:hypothetical protein
VLPRLTNWLINAHTVYEIGPGKEFATLDAAERAMDVEAARVWVSVCSFSSLLVLVAWLRKRAFAWFWIPLAFFPFSVRPSSPSRRRGSLPTEA